MGEPLWNYSKDKWEAFVYEMPHGTKPYFKVRIPLPDEYIKNYLGTLEADKPVKQ